MQIATAPTQELSIHRHCIQQLIHESLIFDQSNCHGFLSGSGVLIESSNRTTQPADPSSLMGVYQKTDEHGLVDHKQTAWLQQQFAKTTARQPDFYLILQCGHKGRTDALLFSDIELNHPLELDMLEDSDLYPTASSR